MTRFGDLLGGKKEEVVGSPIVEEDTTNYEAGRQMSSNHSRRLHRACKRTVPIELDALRRKPVEVG